MKRSLLTAFLLLFVAWSARAEDSVSIWGDYHKERSTRVINPTVRISKDLPDDWTVDAAYVLDTITSASGAFTATDEPFTEYRHEARLDVQKRFWDIFQPGVNFRYSTESDYRSIGFGGQLKLLLNQENTSVSLFVQHLADEITQRERPGFIDHLNTTMVGVGFDQILARNLIVGGSAEIQILRGYQRNVYRVENHPRERDRYALVGWLRYRLMPTHTTGRFTYRLYSDTWDVLGNTFDFEITQRLTRHLDVAPRFRFYTQTAAFFDELTDGFFTNDPVLTAFDSRMYSLSLKWHLFVLEETFLAPMASSTIMPTYSYLDQDNAYGPAHIVQIGWSWPF